MERPSRSPLAQHWNLDENTVFLNHGSFGATPSAITEEQRRWQDLLENEPVYFYMEGVLEPLIQARKALATMLTCDPDDLALIENATTGV
ncbi:MAG: aminotransferase, partial [Candidatus Poseidonia sp.]|nr:aminotransferase [Poseidonia sp.]